jgi:hypothetical protein
MVDAWKPVKEPFCYASKCRYQTLPLANQFVAASASLLRDRLAVSR